MTITWNISGNVTTGTFVNLPIYQPHTFPNPFNAVPPTPEPAPEPITTMPSRQEIADFRVWNRHPANNGRRIRGRYRVPYDMQALERTIERTLNGQGSFLWDQYQADIKEGHASVPTVTQPVPVADEDKITADDPRALTMWADIARTSISKGYAGHYETIAKRLGAPTIDQLKKAEALKGVNRMTYTPHIKVEVPLKEGKADNEMSVEHLRAELTRILALDDDKFREKFERHLYEQRIEWDYAKRH